MRKSFTLLLAAFFACAGAAKAVPTELPEMSSENATKWYTIKNVRKQTYATFAGNNAKMAQKSVVEEASLFYFTGTVADGVATVKIHNAAAGDSLCAETNKWTAAGIDWYIAAKTATGLSISKTADFSGEKSWNDFQGGGKEVDYWTATDPGSIWEITELGMDIQEAMARILVLKEQPIIGEPTYEESTYNALVSAYETFKAEETLTLAVEKYNACKEVLKQFKPFMPEVGKLYLLEAPLFFNTQGVHKALYSDGSKMGWKTLDKTDKSFYWTPVATENGLAWKNFNDEKFILGQSKDNTAWEMADASTGAEFKLKVLASGESQKDYQYAINVTGRDMHANGHNAGNAANGTIVSWETNEANSASAWTITEAKDPSTVTEVTVKYSFVYDNVEKYIQESKVLVGDEYPVFTVEFPFGVTATLPTELVNEEDAVEGIIIKTIELGLQLPFVPAKDFESIEHWYYLNIHTDHYYLNYVQDATSMDLNNKEVPSDQKDAYTWAFIGNPFDGYQIVNKAAGKDKILSSSTTMTGNNGSTTFPIMTATPVAEGNNTLWIATKGSSRNNGFYLEQKGFASNKMNRRDGKLAYWSTGADAGSTFVAELRDDAAQLKAFADKAAQKLQDLGEGTTVGYATAESKAAITAAIATINTAIENKTGYEEAQATLQTALANIQTIQPEEGKLYYIISNCATENRGGQAMYLNADSCLQFCTSHTDSTNTVFQFVAAGEGKYYLLNVANNTYLSTAKAHGGGKAEVKATSTEAAKAVVITNMGFGNVVKIVPEGGAMLHAQTNGSQVVAWDNEDRTNASAWIIVEKKETTDPTPGEGEGEGEGGEPTDPNPGEGEGEGGEPTDPTPGEGEGEGEGGEPTDPTPGEGEGEGEGGEPTDPTPGEGEGEEEEDNSIDNAEVDMEKAVIYDLLGRRIEKIVEKGIYIVNGKKVVIK